MAPSMDRSGAVGFRCVMDAGGITRADGVNKK
jgi:hypothetical protein